MKGKMARRIPLLVLMAALVLALGAAPAFAQKMKLKAASIYPSPDMVMTIGKAMQVWQDEVTRRTNGDITLSR